MEGAGSTERFPRSPLCHCVQVLCWLVEPVSAVIQSLSSAALTDLLQELQGNEGQLATVLQNKVYTHTHTHSVTVVGSTSACAVFSDTLCFDLIFTLASHESLEVQPVAAASDSRGAKCERRNTPHQTVPHRPVEKLLLSAWTQPVAVTD